MKKMVKQQLKSVVLIEMKENYLEILADKVKKITLLRETLDVELEETYAEINTIMNEVSKLKECLKNDNL